MRRTMEVRKRNYLLLYPPSERSSFVVERICYTSSQPPVRNSHRSHLRVNREASSSICWFDLIHQFHENPFSHANRLRRRIGFYEEIVSQKKGFASGRNCDEFLSPKIKTSNINLWRNRQENKKVRLQHFLPNPLTTNCWVKKGFSEMFILSPFKGIIIIRFRFFYNFRHNGMSRRDENFIVLCGKICPFSSLKGILYWSIKAFCLPKEKFLNCHRKRIFFLQIKLQLHRSPFSAILKTFLTFYRIPKTLLKTLRKKRLREML